MGDFTESSPDGSNNINYTNIPGSDGKGIFRGYLDFTRDNDTTSPEMSDAAILEKETSFQAEVEKGQEEVETSKKEQSYDEHSDNDRESDSEAYNFSEDQKRAMEELMTQTQEDEDLPGEDPPEYNVKDTLIKLNQELASVPMPVEAEREHKVLFKPVVVDLVAPPPPDYSDDEQQPSSNIQELGRSEDSSVSHEHKNNDNNKQTDTPECKEILADPKRQQFVVERDGKFFVVGANDLTSAEQDMLIDEEDNKKKTEKQSQNETTKYSHTIQENIGNENLVFSRSVTSFLTPQPPSRSRPKSVATSSRRRSSHQAQSPQRRSTNQFDNSATNLNNFAYTSPYAMSSEEKAAAREEARRMETERKEIELHKRQEEEKKRIENENAFQAWLSKKSEEEKQRHDSETKTENLEREKRERNEEAYKTWEKLKKTQVKRERLLKRRQQEERMDGFYLHPREECDKAFREWLKKKNAEVKRQQVMERQRNKVYRIQGKASKRTLALIRALKEAQAYGYFALHNCTF